MSDLNTVSLIGRLTRDVEVRGTQSGTIVASFSLASNYCFTKNGEKNEQVSFFNCIAWGKAGEILAQYTQKGHRIAINGRMQQSSYDDKSGTKRNVVEIVVNDFQFLESKSAPKEENNTESKIIDNFDENIPF